MKFRPSPSLIGVLLGPRTHQSTATAECSQSLNKWDPAILDKNFAAHAVTLLWSDILSSELNLAAPTQHVMNTLSCDGNVCQAENMSGQMTGHEGPRDMVWIQPMLSRP